MSTRLLWAMSTYAVLALLAGFTLDGKMRTAVWIVLGGLAVKDTDCVQGRTVKVGQASGPVNQFETRARFVLKHVPFWNALRRTH